jgi:asparagine synthase (glutamine-hydrolysing)
MGFAVPLATWFRGPLRERVLNAIQGPNIVEAGFFNQSFLNELLDQHQSGTRDHSAKIWSLLMFESFLKREIAGT